VPEVEPLSVQALLLFLVFGGTIGGLGSVFTLQGFLRRW
jgi:hypothetical protein